MYKYGRINTLNYLKKFGITADNKPVYKAPHIEQCCLLLEQMLMHVNPVVGYANEITYKGKSYDFVLLTKFDQDINIALILLDEKYEWPLVFKDKLKTTTPLKDNISVLRIDHDHFPNMEELIMTFMEESCYKPIVKVSDILKYQAIEA